MNSQSRSRSSVTLWCSRGNVNNNKNNIYLTAIGLLPGGSGCIHVHIYEKGARNLKPGGLHPVTCPRRHRGMLGVLVYSCLTLTPGRVGGQSDVPASLHQESFGVRCTGGWVGSGRICIENGQRNFYEIRQRRSQIMDCLF